MPPIGNSVALMEVIAHRGASRLERENTLRAFERAVEVGAHGIELDVRRGPAGELVVHHDAWLADGRAIVETPSSELPPHVPTLEQALRACAGAWVNVEVKNDRREPDFDPDRGLATAVVDVLRAVGPDDRWSEDRWLVSSFDLASIDRIAEIAPGVPTAWLVTEIPDDVVERLAGHTALHPRVDQLERHHVELLHEAGFRVNTWTCNDPARIVELDRWGVDGVCTDVPDVALRYVSTTGNTSRMASGT